MSARWKRERSHSAPPPEALKCVRFSASFSRYRANYSFSSWRARKAFILLHFSFCYSRFTALCGTRRTAAPSPRAGANAGYLEPRSGSGAGLPSCWRPFGPWLAYSVLVGPEQQQQQQEGLHCQRDNGIPNCWTPLADVAAVTASSLWDRPA